MLLAKFSHARYLTNEILWNVEKKVKLYSATRPMDITSYQTKADIFHLEFIEN